MGQYYYIPDPGEQQRGGYAPAVPDRLAQLRMQQQSQQVVQGTQLPQAVQAQPVPPNIGPVNPSAPQNNGIIWVASKLEADSYLVAPNSAVALWDSNNPVIYLRKADSTGKPSTIVYDLVERTDNPAPQQVLPQFDPSQYMTIEAAGEIIEQRVNEILSERLKRPAKPTKPKEDA